jgi:hypothetical protein
LTAVICFANEDKRRMCQKGIFDNDDDEHTINILSSSSSHSSVPM